MLDIQNFILEQNKNKTKNNVDASDAEFKCTSEKDTTLMVQKQDDLLSISLGADKTNITILLNKKNTKQLMAWLKKVKF